MLCQHYNILNKRDKRSIFENTVSKVHEGGPVKSMQFPRRAFMKSLMTVDEQKKRYTVTAGRSMQGLQHMALLFSNYLARNKTYIYVLAVDIYLIIKIQKRYVLNFMLKYLYISFYFVKYKSFYNSRGSKSMSNAQKNH